MIIFRGMCGICLKVIKGNPCNRNMRLVGLGNTRILTDYKNLGSTMNVLGRTLMYGCLQKKDNFHFDFLCISIPIPNLETIVSVIHKCKLDEMVF